MAAVNEKQFMKLLSYHERAADVLRAALALLRHGAPSANGHKGTDLDAVIAPGAGDIQRAALQHEARRLATLQGRPKKHPRTSDYKIEMKKRRQATAKVLARFDRDEPRPNAGGRSIGVLVQHGFLKQKGDGYVRTDKPFTP